MLSKHKVFELLIEFPRIQFIQMPSNHTHKFLGTALLSTPRTADRLTHNAGQNNFPFPHLTTSLYP